MAHEQKPGWTYIYSEAIHQEIALHNVSGWVYCSDGTKYSPEEITYLNKQFGEIPLAVHLLKKKFGGTVINDKGTDGNKPAESGPAKGSNDSGNTGTAVQRTFEDLPSVEQGQLDIY